MNTADAEKAISVTFRGVKTLGDGTVVTLHSDRMDAVNTVKNKNVVVPQTSRITCPGNILSITIPAKTFALYSF